MHKKATYKEICKEMVKESAKIGGTLLLNVEIYYGQRDYILRSK